MPSWTLWVLWASLANCSFQRFPFRRHRQSVPYKEPENPCAICLEELQLEKEHKINDPNEPIRFHNLTIDLPPEFTLSNHFFHRKCIQDCKLQKISNCPICRQPENTAGPNEYLYSFCWTESNNSHSRMVPSLVRYLNTASPEGITKALGVCLQKQKWNRIANITRLFFNGLKKEKQELIKELLTKEASEIKSLEFDLAYVQMTESVAEGVTFLVQRGTFLNEKEAFKQILPMHHECRFLVGQCANNKELGAFFVNFAWSEFEKQAFERAEFLSLKNLELIRAVFEAGFSKREECCFSQAALFFWHSGGEYEAFHSQVKHLIPEECKKDWHIEAEGAFYMIPKCPSIEQEVEGESNVEY